MITVNPYDRLMTKLKAYATRNHLRMTPQRNAVLQICCNEPTPISTARLVTIAAERGISRPTVYNAIDTFVHAEILQCVGKAVDKKYRQYDFFFQKHTCIQLVCTRCGRISKLKDNNISKAIHNRQFNNFVMQHYTLTVYGKCKVCRSLLAKENAGKNQETE